MSENNAWVRTVYLYLFALAGLLITVIGSTMLVNLALKTWIFTEADNYSYVERPMSMTMVDKDFELAEALRDCGEGCELTAEQKAQVDQWFVDYEYWQENEKGNSERNRTRQRQNQASTAISMIIVGLPLYIYHWGTIKKDRKKKEKV